MKRIVITAALLILGAVSVAPSVIAAVQNCCSVGASCCPSGPCCK